MPSQLTGESFYFVMECIERDHHMMKTQKLRGFEMALPSHGETWEMDTGDGRTRRAWVEGLADGTTVRLHFLDEEPITVNRAEPATTMPEKHWRLVPDAAPKPDRSGW